MTLWETVWEQLRREMPQRAPLDKTWGGFFGGLAMAIIIIAIWFPVRLAAELLKTLPTNQKPDFRAESHALFADIHGKAADLPSPAEFAGAVLKDIQIHQPLREAFGKALRQLYSENLMLHVPAIPHDLDSLEAIRWRDLLKREGVRMNARTLSLMINSCRSAINAASALVPSIAGESDIIAPLGTLAPGGRFVDALTGPLIASGEFPGFARQYNENVLKLSGVTDSKKIRQDKIATPLAFDDPSPFLSNTPFAALLSVSIPVEIPQNLRFSHHWIVAGTGAGKTNALQYLIAKDLEHAVRGECSIIVLDSQHQLIETISHLSLFGPGGPLDGKLCLLDAADIDYPLAINLFDMNLDKGRTLNNLERQKLLNSALDMYDFIIGALLQSEMTSRQSTFFRFVTRALFAIPDATILTFQDILQNGIDRYRASIETLDETARRFFATDFNSSHARQTRDQVMARLWAVLSNPIFERMFSSTRSKVDLFNEMNTPGKVILINAEKSLLKEEGTELFGRFFLALINQAAAQRASLNLNSRLPCFVYVDECHNYIHNDPKIQVILAESRQQNIGVILAHQFLAQIETNVTRALSANTTIKMAARLNSNDASTMSRDMNTVPNFIRDQATGSFATYLHGATPSAISLHFPINALSRFDKMNEDDHRLVKERNRSSYSQNSSADPAGSDRTSNTTGKAQSANDQNSGRRSRRDPDNPDE
ncbi:MAG: ATP-binding protein [Beijerinckiaceae bacterium]